MYTKTLAKCLLINADRVFKQLQCQAYLLQTKQQIAINAEEVLKQDSRAI